MLSGLILSRDLRGASVLRVRHSLISSKDKISEMLGFDEMSAFNFIANIKGGHGNSGSATNSVCDSASSLLVVKFVARVKSS